MARKSTAMLGLVLLIFFTAGALMASGLVFKTPIRNADKIPTVVSSEKSLKSSNRLMMSPGTVLDSTYYDWQRNGGMDQHIAMFDDGTVKINGTMMTAWLQDTSDRHMHYYYHDGVFGWNTGITDLNVFLARDGFGSLSQNSDGSVVISTHTDNGDGLGTRSWVAYDAFPGIRAWSYTATDEVAALTWPHVTVNSDASITLMSEDGVDVFWARADTSAAPFTAWTNFRDIEPNWMNGDMEWPVIHSGTNGRVGCVIPDNMGAVRFFESTDNGVSWTSTTLATADTAGLPTGLDSTAARLGWINSDVFYIGDEAHVAWSTGQGASDGVGGYGLFDFKATIYHWSAATGVDEVVVATTQSADDTRADYVPTPFNHMSVDWPAMGLAVDGSTIVMAYTAFAVGDVDSTGLPPAGYVDIWVTASSDGGDTWVAGKNVTNPTGTELGWDDRYPAIARTNMESAAAPGMDAHLIYTSDDLSGTFVQGTESAVNMDYVMYLGVDISDITGIGDGKGGPGAGLPRVATLGQNFPNPFNPSTTIKYQVAEQSHVSLKIYDVRGRLVQTLIDEVKDAGDYSIQWNGLESSGQQVSSGIYLYTMETGENFKSTRKMVVLK